MLAAGVVLFGTTLLVKSDELHDKQVFAPSVQLGDYCSGTVIHSKRGQVTGDVSTIVLTAKHCVQGDENKTVVINKDIYNEKNRRTERQGFYADVMGSSYKSDLALIRLRDKDTIFDTAEVASKDIKLTFGQDVEVIGYPLGRSITWTKGNLGFVEDDMFKTISKSGQFYRATPDVLGGSSGSPMFTKDGDTWKVIGTLTGGVRMGTFFNFFTPIEEIREYLDVASSTFMSPEDTAKELELEKAKTTVKETVKTGQ